MQPLDTKFNAFVDLQELGVGKIFLDIYLSLYLNASAPRFQNRSTKMTPEVNVEYIEAYYYENLVSTNP